ncbi:POU domain, class 6, transcription factor 2 [Turdus rufiventris]|nr:POU domain, class 6, transcription factor 2 [Turdus rufiventris]
MWKTYCDQIQSDMSKVAHTGDKRSEKTGHIAAPLPKPFHLHPIEVVMLVTVKKKLVNNPLASQAAAAAAAAAMGSIANSQAFGNALSSLQGVTGQLVTNAQGQMNIISTDPSKMLGGSFNFRYLNHIFWDLHYGSLNFDGTDSKIIGTIPLMPNPVPSSQAAGGAQGLQVQPITPQLLTNAQGQIIATVIGNQILPVINTQGITLSPLKPGQQTQDPQTATGEVDGVNLEEIREFAKAFKIRRLSLGLTQTQVGQALSATEGPAYSQSAICRHTILRSHFFLPQEAQENTIASSLTAKLNPGLLYPARFEKLDITPKSAQKIKPVLERWMAEAEARHRAGMQNLTEFIGSEPSKKRKRRTSFTPQALEILNAHFEKNTHPSGQEMTEIAEKLNYDREVVRVWFCNKRQALKNTIKRLKQHEPTTAVPMEPLTDSLEENS